MKVELESTGPERARGEVLAIPFAGRSSALVARLDAIMGGRLALLAADASAEPGRTSVLNVAEADALEATRVALIGVGQRDDVDPAAVRTGAAAASRLARSFGGRLSWAFDGELPLEGEAQVRSVVEGAIIGSYDPGRRKSNRQEAPVDEYRP